MGEAIGVMEPEDIFRFFKPGHHSSFLSAMTEMRECGVLCDVTIKVEDETIRAHRVVLAWLSPYFRTMFTTNFKESRTSEITMKDIDREALKSLIDFAYTSRLEIPRSKVPSMVQVASYLQIDMISEACLQFMYERISPSSAVVVRQYAELANDTVMIAKADQYVAENFQELSACKEFLDLSCLAMKALVSRDDLHVFREEVVWTSVIQWVKASEDERRAYLPNLLRHVRLPLLSPQYLNTHVSTEELIRTSPLCRDTVEEAKCYHRSVENEKFRSSDLSIRERYCKNKHHLKCTAVMGYGLYTVNRDIDNKISLGYYDSINKKWNDVCSLGERRDVNCVACTEEYMYLIGNITFEIIHLRTLERTSKGIDGYSLRNAGVALDNGKIYFFGGLPPNVVRCLDPRSGICKQVGVMSNNKGLPSTTTLAGDIYLTGGWSCTRSFEMLKSAERYNIAAGRSVGITSMLLRRYGHGCATVHGKVYAYGGLTTGRIDCRPSSSCEVYDPSTDRWSFVSNMPTEKARLSFFALYNKLYAVGGIYYRSGFEVESYDPSNDEWTCEESVPSSSEYSYFRVLLTNSASKF